MKKYQVHNDEGWTSYDIKYPIVIELEYYNTSQNKN